MCNCGQKRIDLADPAENGATRTNAPKMLNDTLFEYTGNTGLTATGSATGRKYRFNHTGDTVMVHYKDIPSLSAIPVLKKLQEEKV